MWYIIAGSDLETEIMVSRSANIATRVTVVQGDIIEKVVAIDRISESKLLRVAISEYIASHHPDLFDIWNK